MILEMVSLDDIHDSNNVGRSGQSSEMEKIFLAASMELKRRSFVPSAIPYGGMGI